MKAVYWPVFCFLFNDNQLREERLLSADIKWGNNFQRGVIIALENIMVSFTECVLPMVSRYRDFIAYRKAHCLMRFAYIV